MPRASALATPGQGSDDVASTSAQVFAQGGFDSRDSRASDGDVTTAKTSAGALSTTRSEADRSATSDSDNGYDGKVADGAIQAVSAAGLHYFDWNVENGDATGNNLPVEKLVANVEKEAAGDNSCCVLMHDLESKPTTVEALPQIVQHFIDQGYTFDVLTASSCGYHF